MNRDKERVRLLTRRVVLLGGLEVVMVSALVGRMYYLQVVEADKYAVMAEDNRINLRLLPPPRGRILDRFGRPLADNRQNYRAVVVAEQTDSVHDTLDSLGEVIPLTPADKLRLIREIRRHRRFVPVTVREDLDWSQVAQIEVNTPDLPGVSIDVGESRFYPEGALASPVIGYVAAVSESDLQGQSDPLLEIPGFRIGKNGVEKVYDLALRGTAGNSEVEVNAVGRVVRELERTDGQPGVDLVLTLDRDLQKFAAERLGDQSAATVLMDVHSGDVLAMASTPSYDPEAFTRGLTPEEWHSLSTDPKGPLINKAVAGLYAPGSTFKLNVALAAQEAGISPDHTVFCPGYLDLGNMRFHCWKHGGHGLQDMVQALAHSCDVYFYEMAHLIGIDKIAAMADRMGMGAPTGIDLPGERGGLIPTRQWKRATFGQPWNPGETLIAGIGQGYVLTTPLQLAVMVARIANGGYAVTPHLARDLVEGDSVSPRPPPAFPAIGLADSSLRTVVAGMTAVTSPGGTAYRSRIPDPTMAMAGKTGTSQVRRITRAEREHGVIKDADLPWKDRDNALFVAFAPIGAPRYACAVVVEHGGGGSVAAAPVARDLLMRAQEIDRDRANGTAQIAAQTANRAGGAKTGDSTP